LGALLELLGDPLKKLFTAVLAAATLAGVTACAPQQLSTSDTCIEVRAILANYDSDNSEDEQRTMAKELRDLSGKASDTLKEEIRDAADVTEERLKDNPDEAKLDALAAKQENSRVSEACY
jgi:hypothetical protein